MRCHGLSSAGLVVAGASACLGFTALPAYADAPVDRGWWTVTNPGAPAPAQAPPDVPADGLLVQGGPDAPTALAGLIYDPAAGATPQQLVLKVAPSSATTPGASLTLCPLTVAALNAEQGGPMADAPAYDCTLKVTAAPGADGSSYTFAMSTLASAGPLAVAVLPTASTDRVVLTKPGDDSLVTSTPPASFSPEPEPVAPEPAPAPQAGPAVAEGPSAGFAGVPAVAAPPSSAPEPVVAATPSGGAATSLAPTNVAAVRGSSHHAVVGAMLLALLAAAGGLWTFAGRNPVLDDEPAT